VVFAEEEDRLQQERVSPLLKDLGRLQADSCALHPERCHLGSHPLTEHEKVVKERLKLEREKKRVKRLHKKLRKLRRIVRKLRKDEVRRRHKMSELAGLEAALHKRIKVERKKASLEEQRGRDTVEKDNRKIRMLRVLVRHARAQEQKEGTSSRAEMGRERRVLAEDRKRVSKLTALLQERKKKVAREMQRARHKSAMVTIELHNAHVAREELLKRLMALKQNKARLSQKLKKITVQVKHEDEKLQKQRVYFNRIVQALKNEMKRRKEEKEEARVEQYKLHRELLRKEKNLTLMTAKIAAEMQREKRNLSAENLREERLTKEFNHERMEFRLVHAKLLRVKADLKRHKGADLVKERARLALLKKKLVLEEGLVKQRSKQLTEAIKRNTRTLRRARMMVAKLHSRSKHIQVKFFNILRRLKSLEHKVKRERITAHRRELQLTKNLLKKKARVKWLLARKQAVWTSVRHLHSKLTALHVRLAHRTEKIKLVQLHYLHELKETKTLHTREVQAISEARRRLKSMHLGYIRLLRRLAHERSYEKLFKVKRVSKLDKARQAILKLNLQLSRLQAADKRERAVIQGWHRKILVARAQYPGELRKLKFAIRGVEKKLEMVKGRVEGYRRLLQSEKERQRRRSHEEFERETRMQRAQRRKAAKELGTEKSRVTILGKKLLMEKQMVHVTAENIKKMRKLNKMKYDKALAKFQEVHAHEIKVEESLNHQIRFLHQKLLRRNRQLKDQEQEARKIHHALVLRMKQWRAAKRLIIVKFKNWMLNQAHKLAEEKLLASKAKSLLRNKIARLHMMKGREIAAKRHLRELKTRSAIKLQHIRTMGAWRLKKERAKGVALAKQLKMLQGVLAARTKQSRREDNDIKHLEAVKAGLIQRTQMEEHRGAEEVEALRKLKVRESRDNVLWRIRDAARKKKWRNRHDQMVKHQRKIIWQLKQRFARDHERLMGLIRKNKKLVAARHTKELLEERTARRMQKRKDEELETEKLHGWAEAEAIKERKARHAFRLEENALVKQRKRENKNFKHAMRRMIENAAKERERLTLQFKELERRKSRLSKFLVQERSLLPKKTTGKPCVCEACTKGGKVAVGRAETVATQGIEGRADTEGEKSRMEEDGCQEQGVVKTAGGTKS